ncbi:Hypothetical predicted protein [Olea europaea subsp. europaea]|uniref:Uncharacterized protein n=1 Tax=Olea europaea subsp. europaea TaxID=158383 RepID=A0A8S0UGF0_OLEEU|nr:Hypothetical predicted protein [Olea europaea subsp. europaea]
MKKAEEQGIQTVKVPIGEYLKTSSSQVIPKRKRCEVDWEDSGGEVEGNDSDEEVEQNDSGEDKDEKTIGMLECDDFENKDDLKIKWPCIET